MKPSDRIVEIQIQNCKKAAIEPTDLGALPYLIMAVTQYLDEEWEKQDVVEMFGPHGSAGIGQISCQHEWTDISNVTTSIQTCKKCGLVKPI